MLSRTRVPVVKVKKDDSISPHQRHTAQPTDFAFDLVVNNTLAIRNSTMIRTYAEICPRARELMYLVKGWAKLHDVGDASRGTLSSYAHIILVIFFLVTRPEVRASSH